MFRRVFVPACLAALMMVLVSPPATAGVIWEEGSFDEVMARAKKADKPVMIDFYAVWCGPCKLLEKKTYADAQVTAFSNKFVNTKVDVEKGEGVELAKRFRIMNYPTVLFLRPDGSEIDRLIGFLEPPEFLQLMKDYYNGVNTLDDYEARMNEDPGNIELVFTVGRKYVDRADRESAMPILDKVMAMDPDNEKGYAEQALMQMADAERKAGDISAAIAFGEKFVESYPESENTKGVLYDIAYYHKKAGDNEAALGVYKDLITKYPDDVNALNSFAWFCAKSGMALDLATDIAQNACKLSNDDPGILDTLAEVYFARDMYDDAIETIKKAMAKDPEDDYLKEQLSKFEEAKKLAES
jgi:thioredoxin-like negative regulator of GroEL